MLLLLYFPGVFVVIIFTYCTTRHLLPVLEYSGVCTANGVGVLRVLRCTQSVPQSTPSTVARIGLCLCGHTPYYHTLLIPLVLVCQ